MPFDFERRWIFAGNRLATLDDLEDIEVIGGTGPVSMTDVTGLQDALDEKSDVGHLHIIGNVTGLQAAIDGKAAASHVHTIANVTSLQESLDAKAASSHTHAISGVTGLQAAIDGKSATGHTHTTADTTGLVDTLDDLTTAVGSKAENTHSHASGDITGDLTLEQMAPGSVFIINFVSSAWKYDGATIVARPTARGDLRMWAIGGTLADVPAFGLTHDMHSPEITA